MNQRVVHRFQRGEKACEAPASYFSVFRTSYRFSDITVVFSLVNVRSRARFEHSTGRQHRKPHSEVVWIRPPGQQEAPFELLRPRAHVQLLKCKQCNVVVYASVCLIVCFDSSQPLSYSPSVRSSCSVYASMAQCHPHLFLSPSFEGFYAHRCICSVI